MKEYQCLICNARFSSQNNNAKYCSDLCRVEGSKLKRKQWNKANPNYNIEYSKRYRGLKKEQQTRDLKSQLEKTYGGKFL